MPAVNAPADQYFWNVFGTIQQRLHALETQQNFGVTDQNGNLRIRGGLQPDGAYGIWMLNPTTGNPVAKLTGTAIELLTANGTLLIDLTDNGLTVYNSSGTEEVYLGDVGSGVYGLAVRNPAGAMQLISGRSVSTAAGPLHYNSVNWGQLGSGPTVSIVAGPSGEVDLSVGAKMKAGAHSSGETCWLAASMNLGGPIPPTLEASVTATSTQTLTCFGEATVSGLTPGATYNFTVVARVTTTGLTATFTNVTIKAEPV